MLFTPFPHQFTFYSQKFSCISSKANTSKGLDNIMPVDKKKAFLFGIKVGKSVILW
jgi:hypothetical protein